jgi:HPt (histidine-containing phosphotransfer) domain-containing protein
MREMFLNNGFNDFLAKPLEMNKLNKILEKWVPMEKRVKSDLNIGAADSKGTFFPEIEGIDIKAGITLTGGTEEGYIKVLELFRNDVVERLEYLKGFKELILESRPGESSMSFFITQVHALKSASASIGANEISRAAEFLEFVGKSDDIESINSRLGDFCYNLSLLAERIKAATLSASSGKAKDWNNMAIDREKLRRLKDALASEDVGAADNILAELLGMPSDSQTSELLSKISDQILTSDFSEAEAELDILLAATALTIENQ